MEISGVAIQNSLTVGGKTVANTSDLISLHCRVLGVGGGNSGFRKAFVSAGYTPSGAKTFVIEAIRFTCQVSGAANMGYIAYADNDTADCNPTALTNQVVLLWIPALTAGQTYEFPMSNAIMPNEKYLNAACNGSAMQGSFQVFGKEV